jgi:hypothetical protein
MLRSLVGAGVQNPEEGDLASLISRRTAQVVAVLGVILVVARAQGEPLPQRLRRIAVLDVRATGNTDAKAAAALSSLIAVEAGTFQVKVIAGSDLVSLLSFEKQKTLLGCTDNACLAEVGGAMGVEYLLTSEVGEFGSRWMLSVVLIDAKRATAVARASRTAKVQGELVDLIAPVVDEVLTTLFTLKTLPSKTTAVAEQTRDAPKGPTLKVTQTQSEPPAVLEHAIQSKPMTSAHIAGYTLLGLGGAALVGGVVAGLLGKLEHDDTKANLSTTTQQKLDDSKARIGTKLWIADGLFIGAAVSAGTGLALLLLSPAESRKSPGPVLSFVPMAEGGAVVLSGGF